MIGGVKSMLFGPSRAETRAAVAGYLDLLRETIPGEAFPAVDAVRDYEACRHARGWPELKPAVLLRELDRMGLRQFVAIKVPWANGLPPKPALPKPAPISSPVPEPEASNRSEQPVRQIGLAHSLSRDEALAELIERLARGETIPSQDALAESWRRSKGCVSDWLAAWRKAGFIPSPIREGKCNVLQLPRARRAA